MAVRGGVDLLIGLSEGGDGEDRKRTEADWQKILDVVSEYKHISWHLWMRRERRQRVQSLLTEKVTTGAHSLLLHVEGLALNARGQIEVGTAEGLVLLVRVEGSLGSEADRGHCERCKTGRDRHFGDEEWEMQEPPTGTRPLLELSFYGRKLRNMDFFSKSDPFVVIYVGDQSSYTLNEFHMAGRTETVWDNLNPDFVTKFYLPYESEIDKNARILLEFYDQDSKEVEELSPDYLRRQDFIGQVTFNVSELMEVDHRLLSIQMCNRKGLPDKKSGQAVITAEEMLNRGPTTKYAVEFRFTADCEMPRRKKIFIILSRSIKFPSSLGPKWTPVYRTGALEPPQKSGQEFCFQDFQLVGEQLNALEEDRLLRLELYIFKKSGNHILQGYVELSISELQRVDSDHMFPIVPTKDSVLLSGFIFQPGSMVSTGSAALGIPSSLRFYFTRMSWKRGF